jgi:hypothetical protein
MLPEFTPFTIHTPDTCLYNVERLAQKLHIRITPFSMKPEDYLSRVALLQKDIASAEHLHRGWATYTLLKAIFQRQGGLLLVDNDLVCVETVPNIRAVLKEAQELTDQPWDLLILAANGYTTNKPITHKLDRVYRVRGAKMVYIHKYCVGNLILTFEKALHEGVFLHGDRLLNAAIHEHGLYALGVSQAKAYFRS